MYYVSFLLYLIVGEVLPAWQRELVFLHNDIHKVVEQMLDQMKRTLLPVRNAERVSRLETIIRGF
jgi:hypothetical protein